VIVRSIFYFKSFYNFSSSYLINFLALIAGLRLEAGSFGEFLITTYGTEKMKQFNRLSRNKSRPWKEVFGLTLEQLEAKWLEAVKLGSRDKEGKISTLVTLVRNDPNTACFSAQNLAEKK